MWRTSWWSFLSSQTADGVDIVFLGRVFQELNSHRSTRRWLFLQLIPDYSVCPCSFYIEPLLFNEWHECVVMVTGHRLNSCSAPRCNSAFLVWNNDALFICACFVSPPAGVSQADVCRCMNPALPLPVRTLHKEVGTYCQLADVYVVMLDFALSLRVI